MAAAVGQGLPADAAEVAMAFFRALPTEAKSSMLVDLEAGRPLEMPWLAGRMSELARSHGVPAPANAAVVAALAPHAAGANSAPYSTDSHTRRLSPRRGQSPLDPRA